MSAREDAARRLALAAPDFQRRVLAQLPMPMKREFNERWKAWALDGQFVDDAADARDWRVWLIRAGRGFGKTRAGAEWVTAMARANGDARIALVSGSVADVRRVMVEGESGLLAVAREDDALVWRPSTGTVNFPSGAKAFVYSADSSEQLRGPQHHFAWCDELAKWRRGERAWDNLMMGLRLGETPRVLVTTTPRPNALMRRVMALPGLRETSGRTHDNPHLPASFVEAMVAEYHGTRTGRQELDGELIDDVAGALWSRDMIETCRVDATPALVRVVVGVDPPAGSQSEHGGDACGIVAAGIDGDGIGYVIEDASIAGASPEGWARAVAECAARHEAERVVAEKNQGGEMVRSVLLAADAALPLTLVHASRGTVVGGPIGGALGALAGQAIDSRIFKAKGREGPRLTELAVQTSSYGTPIAKLFGTMRVAGSVIWSTDLIEHSSTSGGGKRGPSTTNYSYSASFAVLLSARAVRSIGRIWADGKLLRGAAGDFKSETKFRLYRGDEAQAPDPLIASAEGPATPAHRGQAYAVFEDMALADFGNRIPSLTFEVEADAGPVTCGFIAESVSDGIVRGETATGFGGYSAYGDNLRAVIDGLASASGAWLAPTPEGLELRAGSGDTVAIGDDGVEGARGKRAIAASDTAPRSVSLQYYDPARDYQAGLQRADRSGAGVRAQRIELPAAIDASAAKTLAGAALARADVEREWRSVALDWRSVAVAPGDRVTIAGEGGAWRVTGWSLEKMVLGLELVRIARAALPAQATSGRVAPAPDLTAGATVLHAFEMPPIDDSVLSAPRLTIAAAGTGSGWRGAAVQISTDGGVRWTPAGPTRGRAVLGRVEIPPPTAGSRLIDRVGSIEVTLANAAMTLADADGAGLDAGANLAIVGEELVQFGRAEQIGTARWRLTELWRGRRGTEGAAGLAIAGDRFVLLESTALLSVDLPVGMIGGAVRVMASGVGDGDTPARVSTQIRGVSVLPPSPSALRARTSGGLVTIDWVRRSRAGWRWIDGVDAPLAEEGEGYRVTLVTPGSPAVPIGVTASSFGIDGATLTAVGATAVEVRQVGTFGPSPPVRIDLSL